MEGTILSIELIEPVMENTTWKSNLRSYKAELLPIEKPIQVDDLTSPPHLLLKIQIE